MPIRIGTTVIDRLAIGATEIEHLHVGDGPSVYDKLNVPTISAFTATPGSFAVSPSPAPNIDLAWQLSGADTVTLQEVVPYFADDPHGVINDLTIPAVNDGGVEVTQAVASVPFNDHFGYRRGGVGGVAGGSGSIADEATSLVQQIGGHRNQRFNNDNFHISWTGMPTSGNVYGRWVPNAGSPVDFTLAVRNVAAVYNQLASSGKVRVRLLPSLIGTVRRLISCVRAASL